MEVNKNTGDRKNSVNRTDDHNNQPHQPYLHRMPDFTDVTILGTPLPQASSTVDRRSIMQSKTRRSNPDDRESKQRQLSFNQSNNSSTQAAEESSLGIINNISSLLDGCNLDEAKSKGASSSTERELARKTLDKHNDFVFSLSKPNKENNVNSNNLLRKSSVHSSNSNNNARTSLLNCQSNDHDDKISGNSIVFEPTEIAARSSEFNKSPEKSQTMQDSNFSGFSFNSKNCEIMDQYGDENFMSASKAEDFLMAGEMSWKNQKASMPISSNKEHLELSCFSGIIGDGDITVDGGRLSAGAFFQNKCGNFGNISAVSDSERPSFGLGHAKSPNRKGQLRPLVDQTVATEDPSTLEDKKNSESDFSKDSNLLSMSAISQMLNDMNGKYVEETPQQLVDRMLEYNKKQKKGNSENNKTVQKTYTVLPNSSRTSLPNSKSGVGKIDKNLTRTVNHSKLSLDNQDMSAATVNEFEAVSQEIDTHLMNLLEGGNDSTLTGIDKSSNKTGDRLSNQNSLHKTAELSVARADLSMIQPGRKLSHLRSHKKLVNSTSINNDSSLIHDTGPSDFSEPTLTKMDATNEDKLTPSPNKNLSFEKKKFVIGKKTQEICTCLVGIPQEADFELSNGTDRWILCSLKLHQVQGEKDNIQLQIPNDKILIEPDSRKSFKIGVKMPNLGKLVIAEFQISCNDMVTRSSWPLKHVMCFVPEEPDIRVVAPSNNNCINFPTITEDTSHSVPITLENKNSIDVIILVAISENKPKLFSFGECLDETLNPENHEKDSICFTLKPKHPITLNIDFKGMSLQSFGEKALQKGIHNVEGKLKVYVYSNLNSKYPIKEIFLRGSVASCKLDVIDTQFPLCMQPKMGKIVNLKNSGSIAVTATADIVQSRSNQSECRDFFICPNNIVLNGGEKLSLQVVYKPENNKTDIERHAMIRIIVGNKVSFYPIIGEKVSDSEHSSADSFHQLQRSETPQLGSLKSLGSPTSPHSLVGFNRSGNSGRHSPGSTASGGVAQGTPLPIRSTHTALVWGSIRTGKSDTKQFTIRNTSNSKIKLLAIIKSEDKNFKFSKDRHTSVSSMTLSLQGTESKTLTVVFAPNFPRAAAGRLIFSHYSSSREVTGLTKVVQLYGYGGYGKLDISEALKDTSGQMWLSLGKLSYDETHHAKIRLHNSGDLSSFAKIKLKRKALHPASASSWHIEPTDILLAPNEIQWVSLNFRPKKDDLVNIHQTGVIHVGTLVITHGDEPTRFRVRRLYKKLKDSGQLSDNIDEHSDEFKDVIYQISKAFPGEVFTPDLKVIGDSVQNLGDLCKGINQSEIKLTIEVQPDETISMLQDHMDESHMFYSLCSDTESRYGGESFMPE